MILQLMKSEKVIMHTLYILYIYVYINSKHSMGIDLREISFAFPQPITHPFFAPPSFNCPKHRRVDISIAKQEHSERVDCICMIFSHYFS